MGNGWDEKQGMHIPRNSTRHASVSVSGQQAAEFTQLVNIWVGAAKSDQEFWASLGDRADTIVEETARTDWDNYKEAEDKKEGYTLPNNWQQRIEDRKSQAVNDWMARPRG